MNSAMVENSSNYGWENKLLPLTFLTLTRDVITSKQNNTLAKCTVLFPSSLVRMSLQEGTVSVEMAHLSNNKNWSWSIHPLVFWTRVLSIGTLNDNRAKTYRERCIVFYGFFCLSCNFISQVMCVSYIFENFNHNSKNYVSQDGFNSNASAWNTAIDFVNFAVHTVSVHLFLIFFFRSRWTLLMNAVENLEPLFNAETFVKIRRTCIVWLTYVISMVRLIDL